MPKKKKTLGGAGTETRRSCNPKKGNSIHFNNKKSSRERKNSSHRGEKGQKKKIESVIRDLRTKSTEIPIERSIQLRGEGREVGN